MRPRFALLALLMAAAPACRQDGTAVLLVSVTASGTLPAVAALDVTITAPAGPPQTRRYAPSDGRQIAFPTTLSAQLPDSATGTLDVEVRAVDAAGATVASGHSGSFTVRAGERRTVYVPLDCGGEDCVVDGGAGNNDGGPPTSNPRCGNGRVDPGETCDTAIAAGDPGACRGSCDDHLACTTDTPTGSDCTAACEHVEILKLNSGDKCCPAGGVAEKDTDCSPTCGNGVVDLGETCDLAIPRGSAGACPMTPSDCMPGAPCATSMLLSAGTCSVVCMRYQIVAQVHGDSCCPPGATSAVDDDCPRLCGNGVVETSAGEQCDVGIPPLAPGACPTNCDDGDPCTTDYISNVGCQAFCQHPTIKVPLSGDGCCPKNDNDDPKNPNDDYIASRATDTDCAPVCGNGVVEPGETCDGNCPTSCPPAPMLRSDRVGCLRSEVEGDAETCTARCVFREQTECEPDPDRCCPANCTAANDPDCSNRCGNGAQDFTLGEMCEIGVPPGDPTHCPMACADTNACTDDLLVSAGTCSAACMYLPTGTPRPGDGCCPDIPGSAGTVQRATFLLDPDCAPVCGNGVVESPRERCDFAIPGSCASDATCAKKIACTRYVVQGSGSTCSASCVAMPITEPVDGDGCCPAGRSAADDSDCPAICGNGVVEDRENCDRAITAGAPGACPRSCDDAIACTVDFTSGSPEGCTRSCIHQPITGCIANDGCCPQGCSAANDRDCDPHCGDGQVGAGETCDPPSTCPTACPDDGDACTTEVLSGDSAACSARCGHVPITACSGTTRDACCPTGCTAANDRDC